MFVKYFKRMDIRRRGSHLQPNCRSRQNKQIIGISMKIKVDQIKMMHCTTIQWQHIFKALTSYILYISAMNFFSIQI
jgi:hypothetical protein